MNVFKTNSLVGEIDGVFLGVSGSNGQDIYIENTTHLQPR